MLIRIRKMKIKGFKELVPIKKKAERREKIREGKALAAAHIEESIEKELLDRLSAGVYEDIYNFNPKAFDKVMDKKEIYEQEEEGEEDEVSEANNSEAEYVFDENDDEDDDNEDEEDDDEDDEEEDDEDEDEDEDEQEESPKKSDLSKKRKANTNDDDEEESDEEIKKGSKPIKKTKKT